MQAQKTFKFLGWAFLALLGVALAAGGQDQGFEILYEGVVESEDDVGDTQPGPIEMALYGLAGYSASGTLWASGGLRAGLTIEGFALDADVGYGTQGLDVQAGASGEISGFGVSGDVSWVLGGPPLINLAAWGQVETFRVTGNVSLAGPNTSVTLSGSTRLEGLGLSGTVGLAGGKLSQASLGASMELGDLAISGSAGLANGQLSVGCGLGLGLGPVDLIANAGYDGAVGINATVGANLNAKGLEFSAVGLFDDTGLGIELLVRLAIEGGQVGLTGRMSGGSINGEVSGSLALGATTVTFSVALDTTRGFAWAEAGIELPL